MNIFNCLLYLEYQRHVKIRLPSSSGLASDRGDRRAILFFQFYSFGRGVLSCFDHRGACWRLHLSCSSVGGTLHLVFCAGVKEPTENEVDWACSRCR